MYVTIYNLKFISIDSTNSIFYLYFILPFFPFPSYFSSTPPFPSDATINTKNL